MSGNTLGLFGYITNGTVKNLGVEGSITGSGGLAHNVAGTSKIYNCYSAVTISSSYFIGGLVGFAEIGVVISNCYATGSVSLNNIGAEGSVGGLLGSGWYCSVSNCYATGAVVSNHPYGAGGVVGGLSYSSVSNCAALNPSLNFINTNTGRIGSYASGMSYTNNIAWDNMLVNGAFLTTGTGANTKDGEDKDKTEVKTQATYEALGWQFGTTDEAPWKMGVGDYKLPVLWWQTEAPTEMPEHLK